MRRAPRPRRPRRPEASPPPPRPPATRPRLAAPAAASQGFLPSLEVYFPEGDLDLRTSRLVNKVFFEGQVKYNFVKGDITAFLRYRYYGYRRTYQISGFDAVEFSGVEHASSGEFDRTRGLLALMQVPHDYHHRTFVLAELDRLTSNKLSQQFTNNRTNTFFRLGYQIGTPDDERSNAIVGETRARVERLFTAYRDIGPGDFGLTTALTYSSDLLGSFDYGKAEFEGLKRFELGGDFFVVGRLHGGSFVLKRLVREGPDIDPADRYSIPRSELFRLDGRNNLKGLSERLHGTEELHTTWELFFPWFLDRDAPFLGLNWQSWYWILYSGYGTIGFDRSIYGDFATYYPDAGIGFESSFRLRKYRFFLAGAVAQAFRGEGGPEVRVAIKSYR